MQSTNIFLDTRMIIDSECYYQCYYDSLVLFRTVWLACLLSRVGSTTWKIPEHFLLKLIATRYLKIPLRSSTVNWLLITSRRYWKMEGQNVTGMYFYQLCKQ